ncbi:MAG: hypothetical protein AMS23_07725, partial [Bacteroides sp. SM1_62]
ITSKINSSMRSNIAITKIKRYTKRLNVSNIRFIDIRNAKYERNIGRFIRCSIAWSFGGIFC